MSVTTRRTTLAAAAGAYGSLDTALNIAFPDLVNDFDLDVGDLQWVVVCFVLAYGALLLAAGQVGDSIGHRRVVTYGAALSTAAMVGCATAPTFELLLVGRVVQGVGTAMVMASAPALVTTRSGSARGSALGVFQTAAAIGLAVGPVVGGPLVEWLGWRGVFWFRLPLGLLLFSLGRRAQETPTLSTAESDRLGALLGSVALGGAVLALNMGRSLGWTHPLVVAGALVAVVAATMFVRVGRRAEHPIIDLALFRSSEFALSNLLAVLANAAMFATWLLVPSLLIDELGVSLVVGGLVLAASPAVTAAVSAVSGRLSDRHGAWPLVTAGLLLEAGGMFGLARAGESSSAVLVAALLAVVGAGLGLFTVPNMSVVMGAIADSKQGVAGGLSLMTRTIGIVAGVAVASALFDSQEPTRGFLGAFSVVFDTSGGVLLLAAALTALRPLRR